VQSADLTFGKAKNAGEDLIGVFAEPRRGDDRLS
jgi:hypothetical protein